MSSTIFGSIPIFASWVGGTCNYNYMGEFFLSGRGPILFFFLIYICIYIVLLHCNGCAGILSKYFKDVRPFLTQSDSASRKRPFSIGLSFDWILLVPLLIVSRVIL